MALTDQQQLDLYNRVMGILQQRWFVKNPDGSIAPCGPGDKGATPAAVLDSLDGNYLVGLLQALGPAQAPVIDEAKLAAALLASPQAVNALGKAIADNLQLTSRGSTPAAS